MNDGPITITLTREQIPVLNDVFYEALNSETADEEERAAYLALRNDLQQQLLEQRT